jgi:hypothetical protein
MGSEDADVCVPTLVKDFIFDLCDSVTLSQIPDEQSKLYNTTFRDLCTKVWFALVTVLLMNVDNSRYM